ncbi:MAG: hypothetical protein AAFV47_13265 [Pseudomonadota bacterium]
MRFTAILILASVCVSSLVPRGFMPGDLTRGQFLIVCPEGLGELFATEHLAGPHHHQHTHGHASAPEPASGAAADNCDFADALTPVMHLASVATFIAPPRTVSTRFKPPHGRIDPSRLVWTEHARAPPIAV